MGELYWNWNLWWGLSWSQSLTCSPSPMMSLWSRHRPWSLSSLRSRYPRSPVLCLTSPLGVILSQAWLPRPDSPWPQRLWRTGAPASGVSMVRQKSSCLMRPWGVWRHCWAWWLCRHGPAPILSSPELLDVYSLYHFMWSTTCWHALDMSLH